MPRGDGTGPAGMGPMAGRGAGYCAGSDAPGFTNPIPRMGMGFRRGFGRGRGKGPTRPVRAKIPAHPTTPQVQPQQAPVQQQEGLSRDQRIQALENQLAALEEQLSQLKDEINQL